MPTMDLFSNIMEIPRVFGGIENLHYFFWGTGNESMFW